VLLLTDGLANRGVTDPEALVAMARGACEEGVGLCDPRSKTRSTAALALQETDQ
jgi:hypothetical protein